MLKKTKKKIAATLASAVAFANMLTMQAYAAGDVSGAIQSTWNDAKSQIKSIVNNVVFPVLDVVLVILLFVKIGTLYMEYRKHYLYERDENGEYFFGIPKGNKIEVYLLTSEEDLYEYLAEESKGFSLIATKACS